MLVKASYDGVEAQTIIPIETKQVATATSSGSAGSGVTSTTLSVSSAISSGSFVTAGSAVMAVTNGTIDASGFLSYTVDTAEEGSIVIASKVRYSPVGAGTWTDFGAEKVGSTASNTYNPHYQEQVELEGSVNTAQGVTGLTAGEYDVELLLRKESGTATTGNIYGNVGLTAT